MVKSFFYFKGEELRKLIGAPAYIECSSKTQQALFFCYFEQFDFFFSSFFWYDAKGL
jgi:hypothetical protein